MSEIVFGACLVVGMALGVGGILLALWVLWLVLQGLIWLLTCPWRCWLSGHDVHTEQWIENRGMGSRRRRTTVRCRRKLCSLFSETEERLPDAPPRKPGPLTQAISDASRGLEW